MNGIVSIVPQTSLNINLVRFPKTIEQLSSRVFKRYSLLAKEYNSVQTLGLSTKLRTPHLKCMEAIMYKYIPLFRSLINSPSWADSERVPMLNVTRRELANLLYCESRNVYNLLARLSHARFIDIMDNTDNGYTIVPNLYLLLGDAEYMPKIKPLTAIPETIQFSEGWQSFPIVNNKVNIYNSDIGNDVESTQGEHRGRHRGIDRGKKQIDPLEASFQKNTLESFPTSVENVTRADHTDTVENTSRADYLRNRHLGGVKSPVPHKTTKPVQEKGIQPHEKAQLVTQFWNYAQTMLYPNRTFDSTLVKQIKELIHKDVFGNFNGSDSYIFWKTFTLKRISEVDLMKAHNEKYEREAYWPLSYFSKHYRDRGGFLIAHSWLKRELRKHVEVKFEEEFEKAKYSLSFGVIPRGMKGKILNISELTNYWAKRIAKRTSPATLEKLYNFISTTNLSASWTN